MVYFFLAPRKPLVLLDLVILRGMNARMAHFLLPKLNFNSLCIKEHYTLIFPFPFGLVMLYFSPLKNLILSTFRSSVIKGNELLGQFILTIPKIDFDPTILLQAHLYKEAVTSYESNSSSLSNLVSNLYGDGDKFGVFSIGIIGYLFKYPKFISMNFIQILASFFHSQLTYLLSQEVFG